MRCLYKSGFTLLELLVVMLIIGLGISIAAVSMGRSHEKSVLRNEAAMIQSYARLAREQAVLRRTPFTLSFDKKACWLEANGVLYGKRRVLPEGLVLGGEPIVFFPKGNSTGGVISVARKIESGLLGKPGPQGLIIEVDPVTGSSEVKRAADGKR